MAEQNNWPWGTKPYPDRVVVPGTEMPPGIIKNMTPIAKGSCTEDLSDAQLDRGADLMPSAEKKYR